MFRLQKYGTGAIYKDVKEYIVRLPGGVEARGSSVQEALAKLARIQNEMARPQASTKRKKSSRRVTS